MDDPVTVIEEPSRDDHERVIVNRPVALSSCGCGSASMRAAPGDLFFVLLYFLSTCQREFPRCGGE
jgi:hypothetical protein